MPSFSYPINEYIDDVVPISLGSLGYDNIGSNPVQNFMASLSVTPAVIEHAVERDP